MLRMGDEMIGSLNCRRGGQVVVFEKEREGGLLKIIWRCFEKRLRDPFSCKRGRGMLLFSCSLKNRMDKIAIHTAVRGWGNSLVREIYRLWGIRDFWEEGSIAN